MYHLLRKKRMLFFLRFSFPIRRVHYYFAPSKMDLLNPLLLHSLFPRRVCSQFGSGLSICKSAYWNLTTNRSRQKYQKKAWSKEIKIFLKWGLLAKLLQSTMTFAKMLRKLVALRGSIWRGSVSVVVRKN